MRYQQTGYSCGPASIVNALRALNKQVSEKKVRQFSSSTETKGTNEEGMKEAIRALGFVAKEMVFDSKLEAWKTLKEEVDLGHPVIVCVDNMNHWITVIGSLGEKVITVDPARWIYNLSENGIRIMNRNTFLKKWYNEKKSIDSVRLYAIGVYKR